MADTCPFLDYRTEADGKSFDASRAYCTAAERFVQPMRADICNDRYDLDHRADCEIYQAHADELAEGGEANR
jgi:hypothetical protein